MIRSRYLTVMALAVALAQLGRPSALIAQSCTTSTGGNASCLVTGAVSATIGKVTQLEISGASTLSLGMVDGAAFAAGFWDSATSVTVTARANASWGVTLASSSSSFVASCAAKSASALLWGRSSGTRSTPLGPTAASVFPSASNPATAGSSQLLFLRLQVDWITDPPRSCDLPMVFTLNAP